MHAPGISRKSRVLLGVHYLTATYSRISDQVYLDQLGDLVALAGDSENRILRRCLRELNDVGAIVYSPAQGRRAGTVGLPPLELDRQAPLMNVVAAGTDLSPHPGQIRPGSGTDLSPLPRRSPEEVSEQASTRARAAAAPAREEDPAEDRHFSEIVAIIERLDGHRLGGRGRVDCAAAYAHSPDGFQRLVDDVRRRPMQAGMRRGLLIEIVRREEHLLEPPAGLWRVDTERDGDPADSAPATHYLDGEEAALNMFAYLANEAPGVISAALYDATGELAGEFLDHGLSATVWLRDDIEDDEETAA